MAKVTTPKRRLDAAMLEISRKEVGERGENPEAVSIPEWSLHDPAAHARQPGRR